MLHIHIIFRIFKTLWIDYVPPLILLHVQYVFCTIRIFVYSPQQFNCWIEVRAGYRTSVYITASKSCREISGIRRAECEVFALLVHHSGLVGICLLTFRDSRNVGKKRCMAIQKSVDLRRSCHWPHINSLLSELCSLLSNRRGLWFRFPECMLAKFTYTWLCPKNRLDLLKY